MSTVFAFNMGLALVAGGLHAAALYVPNSSFESPLVAPVSPYATPEIAVWQKTPQPAWYDPAQNADTPWAFLTGTFFNVPFPGQFIENTDGVQASFLFAVPEAGYFQDLESSGSTNGGLGSGLQATYNEGRAYSLKVAVLGGLGGMKPGATLQLRLYYSDAENSRSAVAAVSVTNTATLFPTNTQFVDFEVRTPTVKASDPWSGKPIGIEIVSTVAFELAGGYWDVDNVRLHEVIEVPNYSFESPVVPPVSPYATPAMDRWVKLPQPVWYDPAQNADTPWEFLAGTFYNVAFPGQFIENADGQQAAFLFAVPEAGFYQDHTAGTNAPGHTVSAVFTPGREYELSVAVLGGSGGMKPGVTLQLGLYYRDSSNNIVVVAATTVTNSSTAFPTNTQFADYRVGVPAVATGDPWAGKPIGIQILSTAGLDNAGGYWDVDNVRLTELVAPAVTRPQATNGVFQLTVVSEPGERLAVEATSNLGVPEPAWTSLIEVTNATGAAVWSEPISATGQRFYRARVR